LKFWYIKIQFSKWYFGILVCWYFGMLVYQTQFSKWYIGILVYNSIHCVYCPLTSHFIHYGLMTRLPVVSEPFTTGWRPCPPNFNISKKVGKYFGHFVKHIKKKIIFVAAYKKAQK